MYFKIKSRGQYQIQLMDITYISYITYIGDC